MAPPATAGLTLGKITTPVKIAVGIGLPALFALAYWILLYNDMSTKIEVAEKQQGAIRADLAAQQQAQATYFADRDELALRQQRQRELNKVLPADTEISSFLSAIQQVSNTSGISLNAWQPMDEQNQAFFAKVPMKLEISGKFHQIAKFAYEMGKIDRIINLENIELGEPKQTGDEVTLKAKCLATAFHTLKPAGSKP